MRSIFHRCKIAVFVVKMERIFFMIDDVDYCRVERSEMVFLWICITLSIVHF